MAKGSVTVNEDRCKGCGLCTRFCPNGVLALNSERLNVKGYHPASVVNAEKCIGCAMCALMCPDVALTVERGE